LDRLVEKDEEMQNMEQVMDRIRKERREWKEKCAVEERDAKDWKYLCDKRDRDAADRRHQIVKLQSDVRVKEDEIKMWEDKYALLKGLFDGGAVHAGRAGRIMREEGKQERQELDRFVLV
jgi:hypothetical protein